jgi:hypothetical protein
MIFDFMEVLTIDNPSGGTAISGVSTDTNPLQFGFHLSKKHGTIHGPDVRESYFLATLPHHARSEFQRLRRKRALLSIPSQAGGVQMPS